jgi:hypothetical protein
MAVAVFLSFSDRSGHPRKIAGGVQQLVKTSQPTGSFKLTSFKPPQGYEGFRICALLGRRADLTNKAAAQQ